MMKSRATAPIPSVVVNEPVAAMVGLGPSVGVFVGVPVSLVPPVPS